MKIQIKKVGKMAFAASAESGHTVLMDASPAVGGENKGARPMEMLLMGLGGCTSIDVMLILKKARQKVTDCQLEITAERAKEDPKVFTHIHVHFVLYGTDLSEQRVKKAIALSVEKYCSASIMLGKVASITHDFEIKVA